jgi:hypothetical protein
MEINGVIRNEDGTFVAGTVPNPNGRPKDTPETKLIRKAAKQIIEEYKQALAEALPLIQPVLIAKAIEGDIQAIKEVHDRTMDKAKQATDVTTNGKDMPVPILATLNQNVIPEHDSVKENTIITEEN